ncbi:ABC transporter permease [Planobispora longispora]|uniref:Transport permease protein n=1 Tax=Planobispora longispora TaxID=28887 RepID=A0A8J3RR29_9ACTN|nr:ABC transporter permease [Planobispora longispora]GIH80242.1 transport permease protein [Planobispora longispora]
MSVHQAAEGPAFELDPRLISAVAGAPPPATGAGALRATLTFAWRALLKIRHVPEQLLDATLFPIMFTLMFTYVFGGAMIGSPEAYLRYALPGILAQTVVFMTMYTAVTLNTDIERGSFDRFRSQPIWRPAPLAGALLGDTLRYGLASALVLGIATLIGYRAPGGPGGVAGAVALLLVFCSALSWLWLIIGLTARTPAAVMGVSTMILFPLTFVSPAFAPPETMPALVREFVAVNPVTLLVEAARGLLDGVPDAGDVALVLALSGGMTLVFAPIALRLYNRRA